MKTPTKKQADVVAYYTRFIENNGGTAPTIAECADGLGINLQPQNKI